MVIYKTPSNKQEYWSIVNLYWKDIFHILNIYLPTYSNNWIDQSVLDKSLGEFLTELKEVKNPRIVRAFNAAWYAAPDDICRSDYNGAWGLLCDLCTEEWCLIEERESE